MIIPSKFVLEPQRPSKTAYFSFFVIKLLKTWLTTVILIYTQVYLKSGTARSFVTVATACISHNSPYIKQKLYVKPHSGIFLRVIFMILLALFHLSSRNKEFTGWYSGTNQHQQHPEHTHSKYGDCPTGPLHRAAHICTAWPHNFTSSLSRCLP